MGEFLKVRPRPEEPVISAQDVMGSKLVQEYPYVFEHLSLARWEDGTARETSSLTLFVDEGKFKCCLHDKDAQRVAFTAGWAPEDALRSLEEGLLSGGLDWRPARNQPRRRT